MEKTRVTRHCGRKGRASHNDRSFDTSKADHIDTAKSNENYYWHWYKKSSPDLTFEQAEMKFYKDRYSQALQAQNERHIKSRHKERVKTIDDIYNSQAKRPCENILQVGNKDNNCVDVTKDLLLKIYNRYFKRFQAWNNEHGNHVHVISIALHNDETSVHIHERIVFDCMTKDGLKLEQDKALELAGVPLPDPTRKKSQNNNRKMTFDSMMRGFWQESCKEFGIDVIEEPAPRRKHKDKEDYIDEQIQKKQSKLDELDNQLNDKQKECVQELRAIAEKRNAATQAYNDYIKNCDEQAHDCFNRLISLQKDLAFSDEVNQVWGILENEYPNVYDDIKNGELGQNYDVRTNVLENGPSNALDEVIADIDDTINNDEPWFVNEKEFNIDDYYPVKSKPKNYDRDDR